MADELKISMLGTFTIVYKGQIVRLERSNTTKTMQALQVLLHRGDTGVARDELVDILYADAHISNPANNLKVTLSNLRTLLAKAELPPGVALQYQGGRYYWRCPAPCAIDIRILEETAALAQQKQGDEQLALLRKACDIYRGDFLPHLQTETWAATESAWYRELYFSCVEQAAVLLQESGDDAALLPIVTKAATLYGVERFQVMRVSCLVRLQRFNEAKRAYEESVRMLREEFDVEPSEELTACCRELRDAEVTADNTVQEFRETLRESTEIAGAYNCPYPSFIDAYRAVSRLLERSGQSAYLMLCRMTDPKGKPVVSSERMTAAAEAAARAIQNALRRGDLFTQPSRDRFLILLVGINRENCELVWARIQQRYQQHPVRGVHLRYSIAPVSDVLARKMFTSSPHWQSANDAKTNS